MNKPLRHVLLCAITLLGIPAVLQAAIFSVSTRDDLIEAIKQANASNGADVIKLAPGTYTFDNYNNDGYNGRNALPVIASDITVEGGGATADMTLLSRPSTAPWFRFFHIAATGVLTLNKVTLEGGLADASGVTGIEDTPPDTGGAIHLEKNGKLTVVNSVMRLNTADNCGGAIRNDGGIVDIIDSVFAFNQVRGYPNAGAIYNDMGGSLSVVHSSFYGNRGGRHIGNGGAIYNENGTARIESSTFHHNRTGRTGHGGAVTNAAGHMVIVNSTFYANQAGQHGGAIASWRSTAAFAGSPPADSSLRIINSTVNGNTAGTYLYVNGDQTEVGNGGGLAVAFGTVTLINTLISGNQLAMLGGIGVDCVEMSSGGNGHLVSGNHNLLGDAGGCEGLSLMAQDVVADPRLGGFTDSPIPGHAHVPLLDISPIIGAGDITVCGGSDVVSMDQIGTGRLGSCDMGAVEFYTNPKRASEADTFVDELAYLDMASDEVNPPPVVDTGGGVTPGSGGSPTTTVTTGSDHGAASASGNATAQSSGGGGGMGLISVVLLVPLYARARRRLLI